MPRTKNVKVEQNKEKETKRFFEDDFESRSHYDSKGKSKQSYYNSIATDGNESENFSLEELIGYQY